MWSNSCCQLYNYCVLNVSPSVEHHRTGVYCYTRILNARPNSCFLNISDLFLVHLVVRYKMCAFPAISLFFCSISKSKQWIDLVLLYTHRFVRTNRERDRAQKKISFFLHCESEWWNEFRDERKRDKKRTNERTTAEHTSRQTTMTLQHRNRFIFLNYSIRTLIRVRVCSFFWFSMELKPACLLILEIIRWTNEPRK